MRIKDYIENIVKSGDLKGVETATYRILAQNRSDDAFIYVTFAKSRIKEIVGYYIEDTGYGIITTPKILTVSDMNNFLHNAYNVSVELFKNENFNEDIVKFVYENYDYTYSRNEIYEFPM